MDESNDGKENEKPEPVRASKSKIPPVAPHHLLPPKEEESILRRSLKEIGEDMKKMEDLITITEEIIRRERERDREFYLRERRRKLSQNPSIPRHLFQVQKIEPFDAQRNAQQIVFNKLQSLEVPPAHSLSPKRVKTEQIKNSPLTFRKLTQKLKRKSFKWEKSNKNLNNLESEVSAPTSEQQQQQQPSIIIKSPTLKINRMKSSSGKSKLIRFSPRRYRSRLTFRNGKIGCIDAENVNANQTCVEKTHAIVNYITSDLDYNNVMKSPTAAATPTTTATIKPTIKRPSITSNISGILSEVSSESLEDLPNSNSYFNFDYSATESDDRGIADDDFYMNSLSDIDSFTVHPKSDEELATNFMEPIGGDGEDHVIEGTVQQRSPSNDVEQGNKAVSPDADAGLIENPPNDDDGGNKLRTSTSDPTSIDYIDENICPSAKKRLSYSDEKAPNSAMSNHSNITLNSDIKDQVRHLVRRFTMRTSRMRKRIEIPPTPSTTSSAQSRNRIHRDANSPTQSPTKETAIFKADQQNPNACSTFKMKLKMLYSGAIDSQGSMYISWLCVVSMSLVYNAWVIPLRSTFPYQTPENADIWLAFDICADVIYVLDILLFKHRIMYLDEGFWVQDLKLTRKNYMRKLTFAMDMLSLVPLDLLYLKYGRQAVYLRAPRLLKIQSFWELFQLLDRVIASPFIVRVSRTLVYMLYMIHSTACIYYAYSDYLGIGSDRWVLSGKGHPYVRCFAFATKTATSIGKNPKPETNGEVLFMTVAWLTGVFIFALLIGQIRDIIATATRFQTEYRQLVDETLEYMRRLNLPKSTIDRVKKWFKFTYEQQRSMDESVILGYLPSNLRADIGMAVHIQTLSKVKLFADCEQALLRDLVLKLRSITFLPDDYVCRKGEIGKEMYIVKWGQVQVMGGPNNDEVLATLTEGSVFGEISLLAIGGSEGNRRTADVKSKGFSNLFVLSKAHLNEALAQYPQAQEVLKRRAHSVMRKNAARERERMNMSTSHIDVVIRNPSTPRSPPKLLQTVIKAMPEESSAVKLLTQGSKRVKSDSRKVSSKSATTIAAAAAAAAAATAAITTAATDNINKQCQSIAELHRKSSIDKPNDSQILSVENEKLKAPSSPDLLSAIQAALSHRNGFMNLTDSEKAFIAKPDAVSNMQQDARNQSDFLDPLDGRMDAQNQKTE